MSLWWRGYAGAGGMDQGLFKQKTEQNNIVLNISGTEKRASWLHSAIVPVEHTLEKLY
jgi:hypothetical protein